MIGIAFVDQASRLISKGMRSVERCKPNLPEVFKELERYLVFAELKYTSHESRSGEAEHLVKPARGSTEAVLRKESPYDASSSV